jgi:hypothetical protein
MRLSAGFNADSIPVITCPWLRPEASFDQRRVAGMKKARFLYDRIWLRRRVMKSNMITTLNSKLLYFPFIYNSSNK